MVETSPAAVLLDVKSGSKNSANSAKGSADDAAFSREFEQASATAEPRRDARSGAVGEGSEQASAKPDSTENSSTVAKESPAEKIREEAGEVIAASGKDLPPDATLELEDEIADDEAAQLAEQADNVEGVLQAVIHQETKQTSDAVYTATKQRGTSPVSATSIGEGEGDASPDEALPFSARMRELTQASQGTGTEGGDQAMQKQARSDNALFTLSSGNGRGSSAFGEILSASGAGTAINTTAAQQPASTVPAQMSIEVPPQQKGWDQAMGERVVWMARSNIQQAQIQLNPRELGPIEIKISVQNDQTHVNFVAHHATTRDAIEAALPRLREMLGEQGLNLGQADVSQHSFGDSQRQSGVSDDGRHHNGMQQGAMDSEDADKEVTLHSSRVSSSAVDIFA